MMIAVGVPAYNLSSYGDSTLNLTGRPTLLGVAGTDVPVDDIIKLALPYKLGVNGYSFIVSNNGYVLLHPDLRPFDPNHPGEIKENYNSVDITEIEQLDDNNPPRVLSDTLRVLRQHLVDYKKGSMLGVPVKFHYDKMRRVAQSKQDFFFAPIPHTPFSLGIGKCLEV
jgi:voltage-dependent calcium channel alpha-2/delta-4